MAEDYKQEIKLLPKRFIVTEIIAVSTFYDAEEYHQQYKLKNPYQYQGYCIDSGRGQRLKEIWRKKYYNK